MGTYYKYAERNADSQINWAEVGKDMSDMLKDETKVREEKKAAIDAASREFGRVLSDPPQGEHTGASTFALKYADNASQFLKMQDRLLKSGQMKVKDYTISRQNLTDGTDVAFNLVKNYQKFYEEKMERYRTDKSQDFEQWAMGQSEIFSNFNKYDLYINPTDGSLSLAAKELKNIDGKDVYVMNPKPSTFATVNTINNWITGQYDKFDTNAAADAFNNALGEELKATTTQIATLSKTGQITTIADITSRTDIDPDTKKILFKFIDAENQGIKSVYANDINRMSAVTNSVKFCSTNNKQYTFTTDETDAKNNPEKIYMKVDPNSGKSTPVFSDVQIKDSDNFMRNEFRRRYDYKEDIKVTSTTPYAPNVPEYIYNAGKDDKKAVDMMQNIGAIYASDDAGIGKSLTALRDVNPNVKSMVRDDKGLTVTLIGPDKKLQTRTLPFYGTDGKLLTQEEFIISAAPLLTGNADAASAIKKGGLIKGGKFNAAGKGTALVVEDAPEPEKVKVKVTLDIFTAKSQDAEKQLKSLLKAYPGFIVEDKGGITGNKILITAPNGDKYPFQTDKSTSTAEKNVEGLQQFLDRNITTVPAGGTPAANPQGVGAKYGG